MVKLTVDIICRGTSGYTKRKRDESTSKYLKRLTHLYLEGRMIDEIGEELSLCRNLSVLYLYDNKLSDSPNLHYNNNITHLYLQNNSIDKIQHLNSLHKLTKLYLGNNKIAVLEGLDKVLRLQELHIEQQKLPLGEKLLFEPRTLNNLALSLEVLNISGNQIDCINDLDRMIHLTQFMASDNLMNNMAQVENCLNSWRDLRRLDLIGNPFCHKPKYRDHVILMGNSIESLDGKEVTTTAKTFLRNWYNNKEAVLKRKESLNELSYGDSKEMTPLNNVLRNANLAGFLMPALPKRCTTRSNVQTAPAQFPQSLENMQAPMYLNNAYPNRMTAPLNGAHKMRSANFLRHKGDAVTRI